MNDLEYQKSLAQKTIPEILEDITTLTEKYNERLAMMTREILIRSMQEAK